LADAVGACSAAASYNEAVIDAIEVEFGKSHREMAIALNNLAITYRSLARFEEAEPLYRKALTIMTSTLGAEHPNTQTVLDNLNYPLEQIKKKSPKK